MTRRRRNEEGFTVVEVLVAATILVLGIGATLTALAGARKLTVKSERRDQAVAIAQREVERIRSLPFTSIGTQTVPTVADQPATLSVLLSVGSSLVLGIQNPKHGEELVPAKAGGVPQRSCIAPASVPDSTTCPVADRITSGVLRGTVYRYVTYAYSCVNTLNTDVCLNLLNTPEPNRNRRVTVVVALDRNTPVDGQGPSGSPNAPQSVVRTDTVVAP